MESSAEVPWIRKVSKSAPPLRVSVSVLLLLAGVGSAPLAPSSAMLAPLTMLFRPAFAHSVRELLGLQAHPRAAPNSFYTVRVAPVLEEHCVGCHGQSIPRPAASA